MPTNTAKAPGSAARADLMRFFAAAVMAVEPRRVVARAFDGEAPGSADIAPVIADARRIYLLAVGKAALGMALEARERLGVRLHDALVIVPAPAPDLPGLRVMAAAHPLPDRSSEAAGQAALQFVQNARGDDLVILLLSGGASALMVKPADQLTLDDKVAVSAALMKAGAPIGELNTVRKHLSALKGGRLLQVSAARFLTLILSDVPNDDLATIGSGPTAEDPTTYSDAIALLKRRGVWGRAPERVRGHLERGGAAEIGETVKRGDPALTRVRNLIVGDNRMAIEAAAACAGSLGYRVKRWRELSGDANQTGAALAAYLCGVESRRACVVSGGETVVTVKGPGLGGRSQQAALALAIELDRLGTRRPIAALFAGTDGIDGPTDAAGAIATQETVARAAEAHRDPRLALESNDTYSFFRGLGDLVVTGPTGTNVADLFIGIVNYD